MGLAFLLEHMVDTVHLEISILNMYIRGGSMSFAKACFDMMPVKDVVAYKQFLKGNDRFYFIFSMITSLIRIFWLSDKKKLLHNFGHLHAYGSNQFLHDTQSSFSIYKK